MDKLYLFFLTVTAILLLVDAFLGAVNRRNPNHTFAVRLLPLALFFWVLVPWFQVADRVF